MEMESEGLLREEDFVIQHRRRRNLLPLWIKIFTWIFMIMGVIAPFGLIFGAFDEGFDLSLYGLATNKPISLLGVFLIVLITFKGITAFSLWLEKDIATDLAKIDSYIGIILCLVVMLVLPFFDDSDSFLLNFRIELVALYFFMKKITKIEYAWANSKKS